MTGSQRFTGLLPNLTGFACRPKTCGHLAFAFFESDGIGLIDLQEIDQVLILSIRIIQLSCPGYFSFRSRIAVAKGAGKFLVKHLPLFLVRRAE
jgi:hypothetical protein